MPAATALKSSTGSRDPRSDVECSCDVAEPSPEAGPVEVAEVEVAVEIGRVGGEGIDNDGPSAEFIAATHAARECVDDEVPAKGSSLLGSVEHETGKQHDWNRIWHPAA